MTRVLVDMSVTLLHHGHIRLLKRASELGEVYVGLTLDEDVLMRKGYIPELTYDHRKEVLEGIRYVTAVIPLRWDFTETDLDEHEIDYVIHGDDETFPEHIAPERVKKLPRTIDVSSRDLRAKSAINYFSSRNRQRKFYTPGPTLLNPEGVLGLAPVFGRGDSEYQSVRDEVHHKILNLVGHSYITSLQGSSTAGIEAAIANYVSGSVLVINSGFYSRRLYDLASYFCKTVDLSQHVPIRNPGYDWVLCAYVETGRGYKLDLQKVSDYCNQSGSKLFVDATGSINLEDHHHLATLCCFSSCKGLGGITGAAFITTQNMLDTVRQDLPYYYNISTHLGMVTGPYHQLQFLNQLDFSAMRNKVRQAKAIFMSKYHSPVSGENQPILCTYVNQDFDHCPNTVFYQSRDISKGSVIHHLFAQSLTYPQIEGYYDHLGSTDNV